MGGDDECRAALLKACAEGDLRMVTKCLEKGAEVNAKDGSGETALMKAVRAGSEAVVDKLLSCGARPGDKDKTGNTALTICPPTLLPKLQKAASPRSARLQILRHIVTIAASLTLTFVCLSACWDSYSDLAWIFSPED